MDLQIKFLFNQMILVFICVTFEASAFGCISFDSYVDADGQEKSLVQPLCSEESMVGLPLTIFEPALERSPYLTSHFQEILQIRAYLSRHPKVGLVLIGYTDQRGTYLDNLARGQRYAESVRSRLVFMGIPEYQMKAISMGEDKPLVTGYDKAALAKNLRVEIVPKLIKDFPVDVVM